MATFARPDEFRPEIEPWSAYVERMELFFVAHDVAADKQVATLLSTMGASAYGLLRNLVQPEKPKDKSFQQIVAVLRRYYEPKPLVIAERFRFRKCVQKSNESASQFAAELQQLAAKCDFGDRLDESLRDGFVSGINNEACQRKLLSEDGLTFAKALEIAMNMEIAQRDVQQLRKGDGAAAVSVNKVNGKQRHSPSAQKECYRCKGKNHSAADCYFKDSRCHKCNKVGHIQKACRASGPTHERRGAQKKRTQKVTTGYVHAEGTEVDMFPVLSASDTDRRTFSADFEVNAVHVLMEIDTGAAVSIISETVYERSFSHIPLEGAGVKLNTYTGQPIPVRGQFMAKVTYEDQTADLPLIVVKGKGPSLCGRNWLQQIKLNWRMIKTVSEHTQPPKSIPEVIAKYSEVFRDELGTLKDIKATISVKPDATPKFHKARPLPFAMKEKVEKELERLEKDSIISPVKHSEWAAPVVPVTKRDGTLRLCGDYKVTVNQATNTEIYPLPRIEEVLATLSGGKLFSKIDLASAYQQVLLDEDSKKYTTVNTHKGLFVYNRLCFGVNSAVSIFQRIMENLMKDLNVVVYLDDLLIMGRDEAEHLMNLDRVLQRLQENGLRVKESKCEFGKTQIEYLGHVLDEKGVYPSQDKVRAIHDAPAPMTIKELRAFLGLVNYYGRFVPQQSTVLAPLYNLLKDETTWRWGKAEQDSFNKCKRLLTSDKVLMHYDPHLPLTLACDASAYGIGAVIQHTTPDGKEHPVAYASRSLSPAEKKYSQIEKEALSLVFGVKKFHQYLWGRQFNLITDHRPLLTLFGEHKGLPTMAAARIQRWAIILSAYDYHILYRQSEKHANADGLSRVPLPETKDAGTETVSAYIDALVCEHLEGAPLSARRIAKSTRTDSELSKLHRYIMEGWPKEIPEELKMFHKKKEELSVEQGCVLWGTRVIAPAKLRSAVLREIHAGHPGIVKMKAVARQYVWWPKIDIDIEKVCKECETCQLDHHMPRQVPLHPWEFPGGVWKRLHIDFAGPFMGSMFMIVVDAYSKWLEVYKMTQITSAATITRLKRLFASYGVPEQIVTDNATTFTSDEFQQFVKRNGILHTTGAPRHPATNGLAERYVATFKAGMKKLAKEDLSIEDKISHFLLRYRTTPNSTTGESPADLFLKRHVRTRLDFLKPSVAETVRRKQYQQKERHDNKAAERQFDVDEQVYLRNTAGESPRWIPGVVKQQTGPVSYKVLGEKTDHMYRRHGDQLRPRFSPDTPEQVPEEEAAELAEQAEVGSGTELLVPETPAAELPRLPEPPDPATVTLRRSQRATRLPQRYQN